MVGGIMAQQGAKKYKVLYDRPNCIGAGSCVIAYDKRWVLSNDDNKAVLLGGKKNPDGTMEMEFTPEELDTFMESAQVCPVNVIHIIDVETGKQLI